MVRRAAAVAMSVTGLVLMLPTAAHADRPVCQGADLDTLPGVALNLPAPTCTNTSVITGFTISDPPHGTTTKNPNVYRPDPGFHGRDEFTFTITDQINGTSDPATVHVIVDTDPTCNSSSVTVPANVSTVLPAAPCSDADNDPLDIFVGNLPAHGSIAVIGGQAIYTPAPGYSGPDSLTFYAEDEFYSSADATLSITVSPPPAPPAPVATVKPTPPPPKDVTAPIVALKNASKKQAVAITLTTNENASATLTVALDKATAKKLKLSATVGTLKAALKPGTSTLKIKLSSKAARAFKKLKSVKLTVTVVVADTAGNKTTKTLKVTLKK